CKQVHLVNPGLRAQRHTQFQVIDIQQGRNVATVAAGEGNDLHLFIMSSADGLQQIAAVAAGGYQQQHITWLAQCADLFSVDVVKAVIAGDGGLGGDVATQIEGWQTGPFMVKAVDQAGCKDLGLGCRDTVAAGGDLLYAEQCVNNKVAGAGNQRCEVFARLQIGFDAFVKKRDDPLIHNADPLRN